MNLLRSTVKFCMFAKPVVMVDNENPTTQSMHSAHNVAVENFDKEPLSSDKDENRMNPTTSGPQIPTHASNDINWGLWQKKLCDKPELHSMDNIFGQLTHESKLTSEAKQIASKVRNTFCQDVSFCSYFKNFIIP